MHERNTAYVSPHNKLVQLLYSWYNCAPRILVPRHHQWLNASVMLIFRPHLYLPASCYRGSRWRFKCRGSAFGAQQRACPQGSHQCPHTGSRCCSSSSRYWYWQYKCWQQRQYNIILNSCCCSYHTRHVGECSDCACDLSRYSSRVGSVVPPRSRQHHQQPCCAAGAATAAAATARRWRW
jgi:hypothetical protein